MLEMLTHFLIVFAIWWEQFVYQSNANFLLNDDLILFLPSVLEKVFKISPHLIIADFWSLFLIILTNLTLLIVYTYIRARVSQVSIGSQMERIILPWPGLTQVTVNIRPIFLQCSSREADQLRIDFKSVKNILHGQNTFLYITNLYEHACVL